MNPEKLMKVFFWSLLRYYSVMGPGESISEASVLEGVSKQSIPARCRQDFS
jgi:hypothetical protein